MSSRHRIPDRHVRWAPWAFLAVLALPTSSAAQILRQDLWIANGMVKALVATDAGVYLGGSFSQVGPAMGNAVGIDAGTGVANQPYPEVDGVVNAIVPDGSGGCYLAGNFDAVLGQPRYGLAQIDASGLLTTWAPQPNGSVLAMAVSGKTVYVGGYFTTLNNEFRGHIGAIDSTGTPTAWEPDADASVTCLALNGTTVYAGGMFTMIGGQNRAGIAAIDGGGAATAWNPGQDGLVNALAVNLGTVYAGGTFAHVGGLPRSNLAAIDASGTPTSWAPVTDGAVNAISITQGIIVGSTTVYVGGDFLTINTIGRTHVASIYNNGAVTGWNPGAAGTVSAILARTSSHSFTVYVGGHFTSAGGQPRNNIALLSSGGAATAWNPNAENNVRAIAVSNGVVYAGGDFHFIGGLGRQNLAEFSTTTGAATGWNPSADAPVRALALRGNTLFVGGEFQTIGGQFYPYMGAVTADTGTPLPLAQFYSSTNGFVDCLTAFGSTIYAGGEFTNILGPNSPGSFARSYVAAFDTAGAVSAWNPNCNGYVRAIAVRTLPIFPFSPIFYLGGDFNTVGAVSRLHLAETDKNGTVTAWAPNPDNTLAHELGTVNAIAAFSFLPNKASIYAGGNFTTFAGQARKYVGAADAAGNPLAWNPSTNDAVRSIALGNGVIYVGGDFQFVNNQEFQGLAALQGANGAPLAWDAGISGDVNAIVLNQGTVYVGGSIASVQKRPHFGIAGLGDETTAVEDPATVGASVALRAVPNPSRSELAIRFVLPTPGRLDARVFDVSGHLVRRLAPVVLTAGPQQLNWDGKSDAGTSVKPGIYFVHAEGSGLNVTGKVIRVH